jgi:hypothetical protein
LRRYGVRRSSIRSRDGVVEGPPLHELISSLNKIVEAITKNEHYSIVLNKQQVIQTEMEKQSSNSVTGPNKEPLPNDNTGNVNSPSTSINSPSTSTNTVNVENIIVAPSMKVRGRPKGLTLTVIGLSKSRKRLRQFTELDQKSKKQKILEFFVDKPTVMKAINKGFIIEEHEIEVIPENIDAGVLDERVDFDIIKPSLTDDAFLALKTAVAMKETNHIYKCELCKQNLDNFRSICCDLCLKWNHVRCQKLTTIPKGPYFCHTCKY